MGVLKQGVKFLSRELRCGGSPVSVVKSDEVNLACDEFWKARRIPVVVELRPEGVLELVRVEGQSCKAVKVLLIAVWQTKKVRITTAFELDNSRAEAYARLPRELTRPIKFGLRSGIRPTPPTSARQSTGTKIQRYAGPTACLEADVIVVAGCGSGWWRHPPPALGP
jgi:hypothetical protein